MLLVVGSLHPNGEGVRSVTHMSSLRYFCWRDLKRMRSTAHVVFTLASMAQNFSRARSLLLGAVDNVLALANQGPSPQAGSSQQPPRPGSSQLQPQQSSRPEQSQSASIEEHRRLFNYRPRSSSSKDKRPVSQKRGRRKGVTWKKDCICLRDKEQSWKPTSEEKIELARMGLGLREVIFKSSGDAEHIHRTLHSQC